MKPSSLPNRNGRHDGNQGQDHELIKYWANAATASGNVRIRLRRWIKLGLWRAVVGGSLQIWAQEEIALGNFCWFGILPRGSDNWVYLLPETADRLRSSPSGIFSWAYLQGCHSPSSPDEWIHAAYQVLQPDATIKQLLQRQMPHFALLQPET